MFEEFEMVVERWQDLDAQFAKEGKNNQPRIWLSFCIGKKMLEDIKEATH